MRPKKKDKTPCVVELALYNNFFPPVIVFATTYFRTLEQSGLSRAISLNQHYLLIPGYSLREVNFLNAWRASQKTSGAAGMLQFSQKLTVTPATGGRF
jgi:hypothetical protein